MNKEEKANYERLVKDLSSENLSDHDITKMWQGPATQQLKDGLSNFKLEHFLISKGVSKKNAPREVKWLRADAGIDNSITNNKVTIASVFKDMFLALAQKFTKNK